MCHSRTVDFRGPGLQLHFRINTKYPFLPGLHRILETYSAHGGHPAEIRQVSSSYSV